MDRADQIGAGGDQVVEHRSLWDASAEEQRAHGAVGEERSTRQALAEAGARIADRHARLPQVRRKPSFSLGDRDPLPRRVVLELVAIDAADAEVVAGRVPQVVPRYRRSGQHRARLGQLHAGACLRIEELEQCPLLGVIGAGRIAGRGTDALVALRDELGIGQLFVRCIAPQLTADALVEALGECLGQSVGQCLGEDRRVVVMRRGELGDQPVRAVETVARRDRERADVIDEPAVERSDEVGQRDVRSGVGLGHLLT